MRIVKTAACIAPVSPIQSIYMLPSPDRLFAFLILGMLSMTLLAAFYLRRRRLSVAAYLGWGLLLCIPLVGPFLVIVFRPGSFYPGRA